MGRKPRNSGKDINIRSKETRITIGILGLLVSIALFITPIAYDLEQSGIIFKYLSNWFGVSAFFWGMTTLYFSFSLILDKSNYFKSASKMISLIILSFIGSGFFASTVNTDAYSLEILSTTGGIVGYKTHSIINGLLGSILEFILYLTLFIPIMINLSVIKTSWLEAIKRVIFKVKDDTAIDKSPEMVVNTVVESFQSDSESINDIEAVENRESWFDKLFRRKKKETIDDSVEIEPEHSDSDDVEFLSNEVDSISVESTDPAIKDTKSFNELDTNQKADIPNVSIVVGIENSTTDPLQEDYKNWKLPDPSLLKEPVYHQGDDSVLKRNKVTIEKTFASFGIVAEVVNVTPGPTIVQYAVNIKVGTKVAKIKGLSNDLALALATSANSVRIEIPIPGTSLVGIEIPNTNPNFVYTKEIVENILSMPGKFELPMVLGKTVSGKILIKDLTDMPHLLVAGATGTGKSVGINSILIGLLMTKKPDEVKFILVDPKMVEMSPYNGIPHLLTPVITDMELVVNALQWAIDEMIRRYKILKQEGVRKIKEYNQKMGYNAMPYIVIVIDEMADLMLSTGADVETKIVRLAQMSRAVGIHLILATQRPSVNVITGIIKANVPGRIAFSVATIIDSRVILDQNGAETLIGKGDMLFKSPEFQRPVRIQDAFTDTTDVEKVVQYIKDQTHTVRYLEDIVKGQEIEESRAVGGGDFSEYSDDDLFEDALNIVINSQKASVSLLQRRLRIGYTRAARLVDQMFDAGAIGAPEGNLGVRKVLIGSTEELLGGGSEIEDE